MKKKASCLTRSAGIGIVFLVTAGLLLGGSAAADAADEPTIASFTVTAVTAGEKGAEGNWVELSWKTEAADSVRLFRDRQEMRGRHQLPNGEIGWPVSMDGGLKIRLKSRAVFELIASNDHGQISKRAEAEPVGPQSPAPGGPRILSFEATPRTIQLGDFVRFSWQTADAQLVRLYDDHGEIVLRGRKGGMPLSMNGALQESPARTMTYKLEALSKTGRSSKSLEVKVEQVKPGTTEGDCTVTASIDGKYGKFTDAVGVFETRANDLGDFLFKSPIRTTRDHRTKRDPTPSRTSKIKVSPGDYFLVLSVVGRRPARSTVVPYPTRCRWHPDG